jgi:two-component system response regulator NreC
MKVRILLVDDHVMIRMGLRVLLETATNIEVVGEARDGRQCLRLMADRLPQIVVMDLRMPLLNGVETTRQLIAMDSTVKVIGLSSSNDRQSVIEMLRAGAKAYVLKESAFEELLQAIHAVMNDKLYLSPAITNVVVESCIDSDDETISAYNVLSPREREVVQCMAEGKSTKEIAMILGLSIKTVESHRRNLMVKIHVDSVAELTKYAIREGLTIP